MTRCPEECGKKWRIGKQTKPGWKKQETQGKKEEKEKQKEKKEKRKEFRVPMMEEEIAIARIVEEKDEDEEEDLIELRAVEEMVPRRFYKYLML